MLSSYVICKHSCPPCRDVNVLVDFMVISTVQMNSDVIEGHYWQLRLLLDYVMLSFMLRLALSLFPQVSLPQISQTDGTLASWNHSNKVCCYDIFILRSECFLQVKCCYCVTLKYSFNRKTYLREVTFCNIYMWLTGNCDLQYID